MENNKMHMCPLLISFSCSQYLSPIFFTRFMATTKVGRAHMNAQTGGVTVIII